MVDHQVLFVVFEFLKQNINSAIFNFLFSVLFVELNEDNSYKNQKKLWAALARWQRQPQSSILQCLRSLHFSSCRDLRSRTVGRLQIRFAWLYWRKCFFWATQAFWLQEVWLFQSRFDQCYRRPINYVNKSKHKHNLSITKIGCLVNIMLSI